MADPLPPPRAVLGVLGKLRGRSVDELRVRGAQTLSSWLERSARAVAASPAADAASLARRLAPGVPAEPEALRAHFRDRRAPWFFAGARDAAATAAALRARHPAAAGAIVRRADAAAAGRFHVLGHDGLSYGDPIDWHRDPLSGKRAPLVHWSRIPYLDDAAVGDHKVVWEVNRHQHFVTLGQARALTGDERYGRAFADQLEHWMDENPPSLGINWASSLEVAFRAIAWLWALELFRDAPALTPTLLARALAVLHAHGRHLERYLSTYFSPNTHLTGEALGLLYLGAVLPELRRAARWRETGRAILVEQLGRQVHRDGVYFEQASYYQRYTVDFYLHAALLEGENGRPLPEGALGTVERLADHLHALARPDGRIPLIGDDDGGRLVPLDAAALDDVRPTLATAAALFGRADWAHAAVGDTTAALWLLGAERTAVAVDALAGRPAPSEPVASRGFPLGGYFVMRDDRDARANYAVVDCGPHGMMNCGHAHADALAMEVAARGRAMLVDAGTYTYVGAERDEFRGSAAHNTVLVDGESQSVPGPTPFTWRHVARSRLGAWVAHPAFDFFEGSHDGYARLADPVRHERGVVFVKGGYWVVRDRVHGAGAHRVSARWLAAPGVAASAGDDGSVVLRAPAEGVSLRMASFGGDGRARVEEGWVSSAFGARTRAPRYLYEADCAGPCELVTLLLPGGGAGADEPPPRAWSGERPGEFVVEARDWTDTLLLGLDGSGKMTWSWVRRDRGGVARQALALRRTELCVDDESLARPATPAGGEAGAWWLFGEREGDAAGWRVAGGPLAPSL